MTVVAARRYRDGKVIDPALPAHCEAPPQSEFDWVGLIAPTEDEIAEFTRRYHFHPLAIEDARTLANAPKAEAYGDQLFVIARTAAASEDDTIAYGQTAIFVGANFIVTVRQGSTRAHVDLRRQLEGKPDKLAEGPDVVLHGVLDFIVDGYAPLLDGIEETVRKMEEGAVGAFPSQARIRRVFRLRRELRRFETIAGQMEEMAHKLAEVDLPAIDSRARPYFRDIYDHARRAAYRARGLNETLGYLLEVAGLLEQSRQGAITRQLAAWAAILAVPTAIAGIYGMNFRHMPELGWTYGYPAVLALIASVCGLLFWQFKRIGWL